MISFTDQHLEIFLHPEKYLHATFRFITKSYQLGEPFKFNQKNQFIRPKHKQKVTNISTKHFWPTRKLLNRLLNKHSLLGVNAKIIRFLYYLFDLFWIQSNQFV